MTRSMRIALSIVTCLATTRTSNPLDRQRVRTSAAPELCLLRRGGRVTKTVTTGCDSPLSRGATASHRVTGNPAILLTGYDGTARHSQLPKLDVAGSIPVARSNDDGVAGHLQPRVRVGCCLCTRVAQ